MGVEIYFWKLLNWVLQKSSTLISQQYISVIAWQKSNKFMSRPACWSTIFGWKLVSSHSSIWFVICQIQAHFQKLLNNIFSSKVGIGRRRLKHGIGIGRRIKRKPSISRSLDLETSPSSSEISKVKPRYEKLIKLH